MATEVSGQLNAGGSVVLDAGGNGTVTLSPDNARQRWVVTSVVFRTNQASDATPVPVAEVFVNSTQSFQNSQGATYSGNLDTATGQVDVGPCDTLSVVWTGGIAGTTAWANVSGSYYTRAGV
jgi:hypothetical protein